MGYFRYGRPRARHGLAPTFRPALFRGWGWVSLVRAHFDRPCSGKVGVPVPFLPVPFEVWTPACAGVTDGGGGWVSLVGAPPVSLVGAPPVSLVGAPPVRARHGLAPTFEVPVILGRRLEAAANLEY